MPKKTQKLANAEKSKITFVMTKHNTDQSDRVIFKIDDGNYSGCIINVQDFKFADDNSAIMTFNYNIVHIPDGMIINDKKIQSTIKKAIRNILQKAVRNITLDEYSNIVTIDE